MGLLIDFDEIRVSFNETFLHEMNESGRKISAWRTEILMVKIDDY